MTPTTSTPQWGGDETQVNPTITTPQGDPKNNATFMPIEDGRGGNLVNPTTSTPQGGR